MAARKIEIAPLETLEERMAIHKKRMSEIEKEIRELSILTGDDIMFLAFSREGKPSLFLGENSDMAAMLERYAQIDPREREKRQKEILEALKKSCKKQVHEDDMSLFKSNRITEEQSRRLRDLQSKLDEVNARLRLWNNPELIKDKAQFNAMKEILIKSLERVQQQKARFLEESAQKNAANLEVNLNDLRCKGLSDYERPQRGFALSNFPEGPSKYIGTGASLNPYKQTTHENPTTLEAWSSAYQAMPDNQPMEGVLDYKTPGSEGQIEGTASGSNLNPYEETAYNSIGCEYAASMEWCFESPNMPEH